MSKERIDILFVDDEKDLLDIVGEYLRQQGFVVQTAMDASQAMETLDQNDVRMVLLDINLAGEDGTKFLPFLRMNHRDTSIVVYTGQAHTDQQVKDLMANGVARYVSKSLPPQALLYVLREVIGGQNPPPA
jgi:DNA-binding response OmpR family regulator